MQLNCGHGHRYMHKPEQELHEQVPWEQFARNEPSWRMLLRKGAQMVVMVRVVALAGRSQEDRSGRIRCLHPEKPTPVQE